MSRVLCIYHGNCADGFTAAWVVRRRFQLDGCLDDIAFHAGVYQTPPPKEVAGRDVIIVDFSYKRPVMLQVIREARSVLVLDHHKTAQADLVGLKDAEIVFDMERSGAMIAWDYFFPTETPPPLLLHIQDRDLWRFALPYTREIQACVFSYRYDFATWDKLMANRGHDTYHMAVEGKAIERKHFKDIAELIEVCRRQLKIGGYIVPAASLPYTLSSDAGHQMSQGQPFAACYWDTPKGRTFSLRSADDGLDVSDIAAQYGGGGHKHAAGFTVTREKAQEFELE